MSYLAYKLLHLVGVFAVLMALGAQIASAGAAGKSRIHKIAGLCHALGLVVILFAGFGLLVRLTVPWPWPGWVLVKLLIWLLIGSSLALVRRQAALAVVWWWAVVGLATLAGYMALYKPF